MATEVPEVNVVAKDIELILLLASNDPKTRSDGIKQIKQLLLENSEDTSDAFQLNDYLIIWRGLFNFMWTSDKPVPQESDLSYLIHSCTSYQGKIFFLDAFFLTIKDNWMSLSQHRIDICMMWMRHCLRQLLFTFVNCDWNLEYMNKFSAVLYRALKSFTPSLKTDLQVIFLEELAKVSKGIVPTEALVIILDSFLHYISELNDFMLIREVTRNVFRNLLSPWPDLETLTAKFQASLNIVDPDNLNNDLELVEGDIANDNSNEINENPLDPQAGNVSVEIPCIKFNPKDVVKVLKKYLTEVDCTRKCLWEITKLIQLYNRLGDCILPNGPEDLKLNSQVLKHKKKKYSSKMVKDGVKRLEMVNSKIKKSGLEVHDHKSLKELNKMGDIVVERRKIGKSMWKVRNFNNVNTLKENFNLNGSWTVSKETTIKCANTVCINDDRPPILVPPGFNVEVSVFQEKIPKKVQNKVSLTPNFKCLTFNSSLKESNSNKRKSRSKISKINDGPKKKNSSNKNSLLLSADHGVSKFKKIKNSIEAAKSVQSVNASHLHKAIFTQDNKIEEKNQIKDDLPLLDLAGQNVEVSETPEKILTKLQKKDSFSPNFNIVTVDSSLKESNSNKRKNKITQINDGSKKKYIKKQNSRFIQIGTPNALNASNKNSLLLSADHVGSVSKNFKNSKESAKAVQLENASPFVIKSFTPDNKIRAENKIDDEPPLHTPAEINVEVSETLENILTKLQKKDSLNPNFKFVTVDSTLKALTKMDEIVVEIKSGKIGKPTWKIRKSDKTNTLKEKFNLNGSWKVSKDTKIVGPNTVCINDRKQPLLVPVGFNVEVLETPEKTLTKLQKKVSLTPSLTSPSVDSSIKELNKMGDIVVERRKIGKSMWKVRNFNNVNTLKENFNLNGSWTVSKETINKCTDTVCINDDIPPILVPPGFNVEVLEFLEKTATKQSEAFDGGLGSLRKSSRLSIKSTKEFQKCRKKAAGEDLSMLKPVEISNKALEKVQSGAFDEGFGSLRKSPRLLIKTRKEMQKCRKTIAGEDLSMLKPDEISNKALEKVQSGAFDEDFGSLRKSPRLLIKTRKEMQKCRKTIAGEDLSMLKPVEISNKALEKVQSGVFDEGFGSLRKSPRLLIKTRKEMQKCRKTIAGEDLSMLKPDEISNKALEKVQSGAFDEGFGSLRKSPRLLIKTRKEMQKCRKTIAGEDLSMLKPVEISNKALEKVQGEAFNEGFGSLRKSSRLLNKTGSAKKIVEYQCCAR